jgi:hypothetical protein
MALFIYDDHIESRAFAASSSRIVRVDSANRRASLGRMIGLAARCRAAKPGLVLVFVLTPQPLDLLPIAIGLCLIPIDLLLLLVIGYLMAL